MKNFLYFFLLILIGLVWPVNEFALSMIKKALSSSPKSKDELIKITKLPERTLRYNISILKKKGLIKEIPNFSDLRKKLFFLVKK